MLKVTRRFARLVPLLLIIPLVLAACAQNVAPIPATATEIPPAEAPAPSETEAPPAQTSPAKGSSEASTELPDIVLQSLAKQLDVPQSSLKVEEVAKVDWPDACLGLAQPGEMCAQVITPGYSGTFKSGRAKYEFRSDETGQVTRLVPEAVTAAKQALADELGVGLDQIEVVNYTQAQWPDACLGISKEGQMCADVITPGYRVTLQVKGQQYELHTDEKGAHVVFSPAGLPQLQNPNNLRTNPEDVDAVRQTLEQYFAFLVNGQYDQAVNLYGGSYEWLIPNNPDIDPANKAALFEAGCRHNGLVCSLTIKDIVSAEQLSPEQIRFTVEFQNSDGSLFILGPCCGATEEEMPPVSQFNYLVQKVDGAWLVMDLPVYVP